MLTMFAVDKLLETITKPKQKTPTRKLQRSPRIYGYEREDDYPETSLELKEPLLSSRVEVNYDQGKNNTEGVVEVSNTSNKNSNKNNNNVRVKVLLTKEEASKMLAKCKGEGALDFKDVVNELMRLPAQRINVVSSTISPSNDLELATIVEEEEEEEEEDEEYAEYYKKNI